jgi:hypothetical protein
MSRRFLVHRCLRGARCSRHKFSKVLITVPFRLKPCWGTDFPEFLTGKFHSSHCSVRCKIFFRFSSFFSSFFEVRHSFFALLCQRCRVLHYSQKYSLLVLICMHIVYSSYIYIYIYIVYIFDTARSGAALFSNVLSCVLLYTKRTRKLTFENFRATALLETEWASTYICKSSRCSYFI